jgi:hypothetical protein
MAAMRTTILLVVIISFVASASTVKVSVAQHPCVISIM